MITVAEIKTRVGEILRNQGATRAAVFGSAARGDMRADSDVDILVEIPTRISLLDFVGIKQQLEDALERKVDLVEYRALKPILRDQVLKEQVTIL